MNDIDKKHANVKHHNVNRIFFSIDAIYVAHMTQISHNTLKV